MTTSVDATAAVPTTPSVAAGGRLDPVALRADFPILSAPTHSGRPLVYLDSASSSQKPAVVIDALDAYYRESKAPPSPNAGSGYDFPDISGCFCRGRPRVGPR